MINIKILNKYKRKQEIEVEEISLIIEIKALPTGEYQKKRFFIKMLVSVSW